MSVNLSALEQTATPLKFGIVLRREICALFCRRDSRELADSFQPWYQNNVIVRGADFMTLTAAPDFEEGHIIFSYHGAKPFNSIYHYRFLPALAEVAPSENLSTH